MTIDRHALLARQAFQHGCKSATMPCTGFDAIPLGRVGRPRMVQRLSLALAIPPLRGTQWAGYKAPLDMVVRDYVDVVELLAMGRWHGSIMAPLVRVVMPEYDSAPVVIADDAPGQLDIGNARDPDLFDMVGGLFRSVSDREVMALLALGLAPASRRKGARGRG